MIRNNSIIEVNTPIAVNIRSQVSELVRLEKKRKDLIKNIFLEYLFSRRDG